MHRPDKLTSTEQGTEVDLGYPLEVKVRQLRTDGSWEEDPYDTEFLTNRYHDFCFSLNKFLQASGAPTRAEEPPFSQQSRGSIRPVLPVVGP
jgi:hypothetical protein